MTSQPAVIPDIVSQFADNSYSLWVDRENATKARVFPSTLADVDRMDGRLDAQLDGLRMSGQKGWSTVLEGLELQGAGEIFTAATLAFEDCPAGSSRSEKVEAMLGSVKKPEGALRPLAVALDWIDPASFGSAIDCLLLCPGELSKAVTVLASAMRGVESPAKPAVLLEGNTGGFAVAASCQAALLTGDRALLERIEARLNDQDLDVTMTAALTALMLGSRRAAEVLQRLAVQPDGPYAEIAAVALFRSLRPSESASMHREMFGAGGVSRAAILAAGASGVAELIPFLLDFLEIEESARLAAEAISAVTGVDLEKERFTGKRPEQAVAGPTEDPADEKVDMDPDEGKPWPAPRLIKQWWQNHLSDFHTGTRYLAGTVVTPESLRTLLHSGRQSRRTAAAELLALRGNPLFDVYAPSFRQSQRLGRNALWQ